MRRCVSPHLPVPRDECQDRGVEQEAGHAPGAVGSAATATRKFFGDETRVDRYLVDRYFRRGRICGYSCGNNEAVINNKAKF